jgi:hypothetical protein
VAITTDGLWRFVSSMQALLAESTQFSELGRLRVKPHLLQGLAPHLLMRGVSVAVQAPISAPPASLFMS